jgi:hypothetical protein
MVSISNSYHGRKMKELFFMFSNEKLRPYIFAFLAFCVFSSKHIIIYNEEILVALSFFLFILFVFHYFGNNIKEFLDERSEAIKLELQNFLTLKQESLTELFHEHKKVSLLKKALISVGVFTNNQLLNTSSNLEKAFYWIFSQQVNQKLKTLSLSTVSLQQKLPSIMSKNILSAVLMKFKKSKKTADKTPQLTPQFINNVLQLLSNKK